MIRVRDYGRSLGLPALPSASSLMVDLLSDPEALKNERHDPGIYDEDGDYIPQYSDDPERIASIIEASHPSGGIAPGAMEASENSSESELSVPVSSSESSESAS